MGTPETTAPNADTVRRRDQQAGKKRSMLRGSAAPEASGRLPAKNFGDLSIALNANNSCLA